MEFKSWFNAVLNRETPLVLPEQAYMVNRVAEAVQESGRMGKPIFFEPDAILQGGTKY